jgi:hypothetical protein
MHPKYWNRGRKAVYHAPADGEATGGGGALDVGAAGDALASLFGDDQGQAESAEHKEEEQESPEAAAERLAAEEAGATQDADSDEEQGEPKESETVTVIIDGKPIELTKEQIAEAHKGQLRQADYTRKTMELAEQRKEAENATRTADQKARDEYAQQLQRLLAVNQHMEQQEQQWTSDMIDADPVGYMKHMHDAQARAAQTQAAVHQLQQIEQQQRTEAEQSAREHQAKQLEAIRAKLPAWKDDAVMKAEVSEIKSWLHGQGFTDADLSGMQDHRIVLMARAAMKHEQLLARAKDTAQKVAKAPPKVEAPGRTPVAPTDGRTQGMKRLAETGRIDDAASVLAQMFSK